MFDTWHLFVWDLTATLHCTQCFSEASVPESIRKLLASTPSMGRELGRPLSRHSRLHSNACPLVSAPQITDCQKPRRHPCSGKIVAAPWFRYSVRGLGVGAAATVSSTSNLPAAAFATTRCQASQRRRKPRNPHGGTAAKGRERNEAVADPKTIPPKMIYSGRSPAAPAFCRFTSASRSLIRA